MTNTNHSLKMKGKNHIHETGNSGFVSLVMLACVSASAHSEFRYTFFEATYVFGELEFADTDVDISGYKLTGQFSVSPSFAIGVSYSSLSGDDAIITDAGQQTLRFSGDGPEAYGLYHTSLGLQTDFLLGARIEMTDIEATVQGEALSVSQNENVNFLFTGLRRNLNGLELRVQWSYNLDAEDDENEWSYTLGLLSGQPTGLQLGFQFMPDDAGDVMGVSIRQSY